MKFRKEYIKHIAAINLAVQFLILGISSFHYHNPFNFTFSSTTLFSSTNTVKISDPFLSDTGQCRLLEFIHTTYSTLITPHFSSIFFNDIKIISRFLDYPFYQSFQGYHSSLRAPPVS